MKYCFICLLCCNIVVAQQISFDSLWKERDRIPNSFIDGIITEEFALKRIEFIHKEFKKRGKLALSQEKDIFTAYIYFGAQKNNQSISALKIGLQNIIPKNDTLLFKYNSLASYIHNHTNEYKQASLYFNENYKLLQKDPNIEEQIANEVIAFYNNYTSFLSKNGEAVLLEKMLFRALDLSSKLKKVDYKGIVESQLGNLYFLKKDFTKAEQYFVLSIKDTQKAYYKLPRLISLGELYAITNEQNKLRAVLRDAKTKFNLIENSNLEVSGLRIAILESRLYHSTKLLSRAIEQFEKNANSPKNIYLGKAYLELANRSPEPAKYYKAAILASVVSENLDNIGSADVLFPDLYMQANKKLAGVQSNITATQTLANAAKIALQINKSLVYEDQKYAFDEEYRSMLSQGLLKNTGPASAFNFIELSKAKVLNDALFDKYNKQLSVKPDLLKKENDLQKKINKLRLNKEEASKKELTDLEIEMGFLKKKIEVESPRYFKSKYAQEIVTAQQIQKSLGADAAFLNYFRDKNTLYISIITNEKIELVNKKLPSNYESIIKDFIKTLYENPGLGNYKSGENHVVYKLLFEPLLAHIKGKNRITIVRDLELNLIPFEVLEASPKQYLIDQYTFSYDYSASIHLTNKANSAKVSIKNQMGIAPFADKASILKNTYREKNLNPLPFSADEISKISGTIFKNNSATKNRFLEDYRKHDVIHFATHAQVDDSDPSKSFIAFYPSNSEYRLFTEELYGLDLSKTQLVILSACEAGNGKLLAGEGLLSLSRGFSYAGCPAVITTLWKAHDESSAWISSRIHEYLNDGLEKAEAIRKAKIDFRDSELGMRYDHPYYWANFILIGNDAPLQISVWNKYKWQLCVAFVLLCLLLYFVYRKIKK